MNCSRCGVSLCWKSSHEYKGKTYCLDCYCKVMEKEKKEKDEIKKKQERK